MYMKFLKLYIINISNGTDYKSFLFACVLRLVKHCFELQPFFLP